MPSDISFGCPTCGASFRVPAAAAGRTARCKRCDAQFQIPSPSPSGQPPTYPQQENEPAAPPAVTDIPAEPGTDDVHGPDPEDPEASQRNTRSCPFCAEPIQAAAIKCKHCGEYLNGTSERINASAGSRHLHRLLDRLKAGAGRYVFRPVLGVPQDAPISLRNLSGDQKLRGFTIVATFLLICGGLFAISRRGSEPSSVVTEEPRRQHKSARGSVADLRTKVIRAEFGSWPRDWASVRGASGVWEIEARVSNPTRKPIACSLECWLEKGGHRYEPKDTGWPVTIPAGSYVTETFFIEGPQSYDKLHVGPYRSIGSAILGRD